MKKLFRVSVENEIYVMAEDQTKAELEANRSIRDEDSDFYCCAMEVKPSDCLDLDWKDSYPYGSDDSRTCGEIVKEMLEEAQSVAELKKNREEIDKKQLKFNFR